MTHRTFAASTAAAVVAALALAGPARAAPVVDPTGDFIATFGGTATPDIDVVSVEAMFNVATNVFTIVGTMAGTINNVANHVYVWGVNRGAGTAGFASIGATNVLFDRVIVLRPNGTGNIGATALPAGSVVIDDDTITATIPASLLPSTGFGLTDYTWNLWPRDTTAAGPAAISDFAPDNSNIATLAVPEPGSLALMAASLLAVAAVRRRTAVR